MHNCAWGSGLWGIQRSKVYARSTASASHATIGNGPDDFVSIDLIRALSKSRADVEYILAVQGVFSKIVRLFPIKKTNAVTIIRRFFDDSIPNVGKIRRLQRFHGSRYTSYACKLESEGIKLVYSAIQHPNSNMIKCVNFEIGKFMRIFTSHNHKAWAMWVKEIDKILNELPHGTTDFTPVKLHFNIPPMRAWSSLLPEKREALTHEQKLKLAEDRIRSEGKKRVHKYSHNHKLVLYHKEDKMLVQGCNILDAKAGIIAKLLPLSHGPYCITKSYYGSTYSLTGDNGETLQGLFHSSSLWLFYRNGVPPQEKATVVSSSSYNKFLSAIALMINFILRT